MMEQKKFCQRKIINKNNFFYPKINFLIINGKSSIIKYITIQSLKLIIINNIK